MNYFLINKEQISLNQALIYQIKVNVLLQIIKMINDNSLFIMTDLN